MLKQLWFLISSASLFLLLISCAKEYSYENGIMPLPVSVASFSFAGNCPTAIINGKFTSGTPLTAANTVTIKLIVDSVGTYSISTNKNNGITFSATGTFTVTGEQIINLAGSGVPSTSGNVDFKIDNYGCSFSVSVEARPLGTAVFTYDGAPNNCTNISRGGSYTAGIPMTSSNVIKIDVNVSITGTYSISTPVVNGFSFVGSGTLETAGYQVVTLVGAGTPLVDGSFTFTPANNGCPFPISVSP